MRLTVAVAALVLVPSVASAENATQARKRTVWGVLGKPAKIADLEVTVRSIAVGPKVTTEADSIATLLVVAELTNRTKETVNPLNWVVECLNLSEPGRITSDTTFPTSDSVDPKSIFKGLVVIVLPKGCKEPLLLAEPLVRYNSEVSGLRYKLPKTVLSKLK